jgi:hypothetical protein
MPPDDEEDFEAAVLEAADAWARAIEAIVEAQEENRQLTDAEQETLDDAEMELYKAVVDWRQIQG